jgi:hypothetical protein
MPNWTSNTLRAEGDQKDLRAFLDAVKWQDEIFDFNRIVPMPEILKHTRSGFHTIDGEEVTSWYILDDKELLPSGDHIRRFTPEEEAILKDIGHTDWYSWSYANWGTKWNACHSEIAEDCAANGYIEIRFDTAWAPPLPVFHKRKLSLLRSPQNPRFENAAFVKRGKLGYLPSGRSR